MLMSIDKRRAQSTIPQLLTWSGRILFGQRIANVDNTAAIFH